MGFGLGFSGPWFFLGLICMVVGSEHWFAVGQPQWGTKSKISQFSRDRNSLFCQTTAVGSSQTCWKSSTSTGIREQISAHGYFRIYLFMPCDFVLMMMPSFVVGNRLLSMPRVLNFKEIASSIGWDSHLIPGTALRANFHISNACSF